MTDQRLGGAGEALEEIAEGVQEQMSKPITRTMAPATKPFGRDDATPRYGSGSVKRYTAIGTAMY